MGNKEHLPFEATHPGEVLKDELEARSEMTQKKLAELMGVKASFLNEIIKGKRPISADTAILLEEVLDIKADFWLKFQMQYELQQARLKKKNKDKLDVLRKLRKQEEHGKTYVQINSSSAVNEPGEKEQED